MEQRKLVVLGIPWDVDTEGLREYMSKYGELEDCIVMKERSIGRSRGFGYVTFASMDDAKDVLSGEHVLGNRMLEVKVATPKWGYGIPSGRPSRADWRDLGMGHDEMRGLLPIAFEYSARMLFTKASSSAHMLHAMNCAPK